jgi:protein MpaA
MSLANTITSVLVGYSESERPVYMEKINDSDKNILIIAVIHGNEWSGYPLLRSFLEEIDRNQTISKNTSLLLLPIANPDAYAIDRRNNLNWVDINRNFPADNYGKSRRDGAGSFSEKESQIIDDIVEKYKVEGIVVFHEPFDCIDYNGPAKNWAEFVGKQAQLPVKKLSEMSGSIGSYFGKKRNIPVLTVELPAYSHVKSVDYLWETYRNLLFLIAAFWEENAD